MQGQPDNGWQKEMSLLSWNIVAMTTWPDDKKDNGIQSSKVILSRKHLFTIAGAWCLIGFVLGFLVFAE
jgi:hypothetical protein